jgi:hypothetical protein
LLRKCKDITPFWAAKFMEHLEEDPKRLKARIKKGNWDVIDIEKEKGLLRPDREVTDTILRQVKR